MTKAIFNNKIEKPVWSKKNTLEHKENNPKLQKYYSPLPTTTDTIASITSNESVKDYNNISCSVMNIVNNSNAADLRCIPNIPDIHKYITEISGLDKEKGQPINNDPRNIKFTLSALPVNYDSNGKLIFDSGPITLTLPVTNTNTAILINDKYTSYMALPTSDD